MYQDKDGRQSFVIDTSPNSDDAYLLDHKIDGRSIFPASSYLVFAWQSFVSKC